MLQLLPSPSLATKLLFDQQRHLTIRPPFPVQCKEVWLQSLRAAATPPHLRNRSGMTPASWENFMLIPMRWEEISRLNSKLKIWPDELRFEILLCLTTSSLAFSLPSCLSSAPKVGFLSGKVASSVDRPTNRPHVMFARSAFGP